MDCTDIRNRILEMVKQYYFSSFPPGDFIPGKTPVPVSGRVFDEEDISLLVEASLDFWLTSGPYAEWFEKKFAEYIGVSNCLLVNSGSSANLVAISSLRSPRLGSRSLKEGDEVITVAAGFPTTVSPIYQNGLVPVYVDVSIPSCNVDPENLEKALSPRTRAVVLAHTLGNPFNVERICSFCRDNGLWLVEDCCDALGSLYDSRKTGTFGDLSTFSFYPAHHITMGEGGAVVTDDPEMAEIVRSIRDWGRDCRCRPGQSNICGKRFAQQHGDLPFGYDHKYVYSHMGYNLKVTDMQAAVGCSQMKKLPMFIKKRRENYSFLREGLADLEDVLLFTDAERRSEPSWFGFPMGLREGSYSSRNALVDHLEKNRIGTRLLFGGNLVKQPAFMRQVHRVPQELANTDYVMNNLLWIGVYPGLTREMLDHMINTVRSYFRR